jgi:hypothetical protein
MLEEHHGQLSPASLVFIVAKNNAGTPSKLKSSTAHQYAHQRGYGRYLKASVVQMQGNAVGPANM